MTNSVPYITRNIDELGRVVIPKEIRQRMNILVGDDVGIIPTEEGVLLVPVSKAENIGDEIRRLARVINENFPVKSGADSRKRDMLMDKTHSMLNILNDVPENDEPIIIE